MRCIKTPHDTHLLLELDVFDDSLDDHVHAREFGIIQHAPHARPHLLCLLGTHAPFFHPAGQVGTHTREACIQKLLVDLLEEHLHASQSTGGGDPRAHEPTAQHGDGADAAGLEAAVGHAADLFGGTLREKDVHERTVRVEGGGGGKRAFLCNQPGASAL